MDLDKKNVDFWTISFSIISLALLELTLIVPKQRIFLSIVLIISILFTLILFYINKIDNNEKSIKYINDKILELTDKFNSVREFNNLKMEFESFKRKYKKAQINLMDIIKVLVAILLIYVIIETLKSL